MNTIEIGIDTILNDKDKRLWLVRNSHRHFFEIYFAHYKTYPFSPMHQEIFALSEDFETKHKVVCAFRGSGKSSIITTSYPLWAVMGCKQLKFVMIVAKTQDQAKSIIKNIKLEIESNQVLRGDLGPFHESQDQWNNTALVIPSLGAKILGVSIEQSMRGIRHGRFRPQLIIADDIEDLSSVKTEDSRDKTYRMIFSEIIPAGSEDSTMFIVGNLLHDDSVVSRLKHEILKQEFPGKYLEYPILDENDVPTWTGRFPDLNSVLMFKKEIANQEIWDREYMLKIRTDAERIIINDWIKYYNSTPNDSPDYKHIVTSIALDPACTTGANSDFSAIICAELYLNRNTQKAETYILPTIINEKLNSEDLFNLLISVIDSHTTEKLNPVIYIEDVGFQKSIGERLKAKGYWVKFYKPIMDKRQRLYSVSSTFSEGRVLFPKDKSKNLVNQILNLGMDRYDDLADAAVMTLIMHQNENVFEDEMKEIAIDIGRSLTQYYDHNDELCELPIMKGIWDMRF